ncbi:thiamine pyrophosphate-dependent dehydrogenase E1 component subunit alpha [Candidatus Woesearchaeota archaeon]|nr:thiamine pyrophosphate-dependent dehydrogenase E1 component subunit alpha [Candidatus Woesearchaeota archaeon]
MLLSLYRQMLLIRRLEERIAEKYQEREMRCPVHLSIGQEAVAVGVCANLSAGDMVFSGHRGHAHYLAKGGSPDALIAELYGKVTGCSGGRGGSMLIIDKSVNFRGTTPIVGGTIPIAAGMAWALQMQQKNAVVAVFFGDGAVEEGVLHETLNFASLHHLPILFVCENNLYSVLTTLDERQPDRPITDIAQGHGVHADHGDGNDIIEVYEKTRDAVSRIRAGKGPAFLEFATYRWKEHSGPFEDTGKGRRTAEELHAWKARCPLEAFRRQLVSQGILSEEAHWQIEKEIDEQIVRAFAFARQSPFPEEGTLGEHLYAK